MQARFWEHNTGLVKVKLDAGKTFHHSHGGATDEGYHWEARRYSFDGKTVVCEWTTDSRDCDGRYTRGGVSVCDVDQLRGGYDDQENGVRFPAWRDQKDEAYQRDHSAEAAGY